MCYAAGVPSADDSVHLVSQTSAISLWPGEPLTGHARLHDTVIAAQLEFLRPMTVSILSERRALSPFGLEGGGSALPGLNILQRTNARCVNLGAKATVQLQSGERLRLLTPGEPFPSAVLSVCSAWSAFLQKYSFTWTAALASRFLHHTGCARNTSPRSLANMPKKRSCRVAIDYDCSLLVGLVQLLSRLRA